MKAVYRALGSLPILIDSAAIWVITVFLTSEGIDEGNENFFKHTSRDGSMYHVYFSDFDEEAFTALLIRRYYEVDDVRDKAVLKERFVLEATVDCS